jgi:alkylresorcinol/alkylpyrone synthase
MRIAAVGKAFPSHYYDQDALIQAIRQHWAPYVFNLERLESLHRHVLVGGRHLALPLERYPRLSGFGEANNAWIEVAQQVGEAALRQALERAGLAPADIHALLFTTVTGLATPSLDARLANRMGFAPHLKRTPLFGLGCVAGAAGIARAGDYLRGHPDDVAVLLSVELCSLTVQRDDFSIPNLIATGLFGDGAAAVVMVGANRGGTGPRVVATRSVFYPDSEEIMGWEIGERGFKLVLSRDVPRIVRDYLRGDIDAFLSDHGLRIGDIQSWIAHPGGPKVLEAFQQTLELPAEALELTWKSLQEVGNISSTSVLLVLEEVMAKRCPPAGSYGLLLAMGPGFCSELVLLEF